MTTTLDYALLAGAAYYSTRAEVNRFPIPNEWSEVVAERVADTQTGFEARTFQKGSEIVISFAGTDPNNSVHWIDPLALDLNGDGKISTTASVQSNAYFDFNNDGIAERTGWVAPGDGRLTLDADNIIGAVGTATSSALLPFIRHTCKATRKASHNQNNSCIRIFDEGHRLIFLQGSNRCVKDAACNA